MYRDLKIWMLLIGTSVVLSCNTNPPPAPKPKPKLVEKVHVIDGAHNYSPLTPIALSRVCPQDANDEITFTPIGYEESMSCSDMVPGLEHLQLGFHPNHFREFGDQSHRVYHRIFEFKCPGSHGNVSRRFNDFVLPDEVLFVYSDPTSMFFTEIVTSRLLVEALKNSMTLESDRGSFIFDLPQLRVMMESEVDRCAYLCARKNELKAILRTDIKPLPAVLKEYSSLPGQLMGNEQLYFSFLLKFGSHIYRTAILGGQMTMVVTSSTVERNISYADLNITDNAVALLDSVLKMESNSVNRLCILHHGGDSIMEVNKWKQSVQHFPVPLEGTYIPIETFLEGGKTTTKSENFKIMEDFEKSRNLFRRIVYTLKNNANRSGKLMEYIVKAANSEARKLCPSTSLNNIIQTGIDREKNYDLDKFFIKCEYQETTSKTIEKYNNHIYLLEGLCVNLKSVLPKCQNFKYNTNNCFVFFEGEGCDFNKKNYKVQNLEQMKKYFPVTRSIRLCTHSLP